MPCPAGPGSPDRRADSPARRARPPGPACCPGGPRASRLPALRRERRLGRGEAGDRYAVGRAGDVIEASGLAERDRGGIAAVLAADAKLDVAPLGAASLGREPDQIAHALDV